jgi:hypothetical protein
MERRRSGEYRFSVSIPLLVKILNIDRRMDKRMEILY